ncbi:MAG: PAS domain S-box protein, partial [Acidobacteria bacterium]|nr:PAS domain S-box protein [Acidobacteriota bacterium]
MSAPSNTRLLSEFRTFARWAGSAAAATGMLVLLGWALDIATLKRVLPHLSSMKPNTAVGLILTGVSLLLLQREWPGGRRGRSASVVSQLCAGAVVLIGALTLTEHWTGWDLRIDQILFQDTSALPGELHPLRMGMIAGLSFVLTGCALLWFDVETRNARRPAEWLSFLAGLIALVVLIAYAYSVESIVGLASDTEVALHTAVTFALLSIGILCARPDRGTMALVTADSIAGLITRRFLPVAIVVPALLGWLRLLGQRAAYYGTEFGLALFTTSNIVIFVLLILASSRQIDRFDARRRRAEEEINRLFTFSQDLLCVAGFDGYFKRLNPAWEKALGYTLEELKAKPYVEFLHPEDRAATLAEAGGLSSGQLTSALENRYQAKDGSYKWLSWNSYPLPEEQLIYGSARDITERKEAEEHVRVLNAT